MIGAGAPAGAGGGTAIGGATGAGACTAAAAAGGVNVADACAIADPLWIVGIAIAAAFAAVYAMVRYICHDGRIFLKGSLPVV